ncbi:MAG TPA: aminodeoxychorismate synthase component I [Rhizomicrobium sp.]|nr:aminodeoxychorismate synthase component I [Rhizomicrobium sp.]
MLLLDDAMSETAARFRDPLRIVVAHQPSELAQALEDLEKARIEGRHLAGWLGYELGYALEPKLKPLFWQRPGLPLLWMGIFDAPENVARADLQPAGRAYAGPPEDDWKETDYAARFARVKDYIAAGDIYQANLSFQSRFAFAGDPLALYLALREAAAARHCAYVDMGDRQVLSLSPELFFELSLDGRIMARPMKGTASRGSDAHSDALNARALAASTKNRAENLMIVDLLRNDLGRIAQLGSVKVPELFAIETYPTLHTMVSTVEAQLRPKTSMEAILRALFPCGSVTGAPKIRAMEIIRELETEPRGVYCGAIGHFAPDGSASFNVAIRTILLEGHRGTLGLGGAVVADSNAKDEYAECLLKARFFARGRKSIGLIETLRWDGAFVRLDKHLERMRRSAAHFGLPFDMAAARSALEQAVGAATGILRVRLELGEDGRFCCTTATLEDYARPWVFALSDRRVDSRDSLLRHKTTWRDFFDEEYECYRQFAGADEVLFFNERGELAEGSRTNVFLRRGDRLLTPASSCGLLAGVLRRTLLEEGACEEAVLTRDDLAAADGVFLGNSLRGLIKAFPAAQGPVSNFSLPAKYV